MIHLLEREPAHAWGCQRYLRLSRQEDNGHAAPS